MDKSATHAAAVDAWLERCAAGATDAQLASRFGAALGALWDRANETLGEVTLAAVTRRVIYTAERRFSVLSALDDLHAHEASLRALHIRAGCSVSAQALLPAVRFVMTDFLTVLGNLTAQILTPALHAELSRLGVEGGTEENAARGTHSIDADGMDDGELIA